MQIFNIPTNKNRQIQKNRYTIRFIKLFPNFNEFYNAVSSYNKKIDKNDMQTHYEMINIFGGGLFMKWTEWEQAKLNCVMIYTKLYNQWKRNIEIYEYDTNKLLISESRGKNYLTNENGDISNKSYLVSENVSERNNIQNLAEAKIFFENLQEPTQELVNNFIYEIIALRQPQTYQASKNKQDFNSEEEYKNE